MSEPTKKPWQVDYALVYDNGYFEWSQHYRTKLGALLSLWRQKYISSWGGSAVLTHRDERLAIRAEEENQRWIEDPDGYLANLRGDSDV